MKALWLGFKSLAHRPLNSLLSILLLSFGLALSLMLLIAQSTFEADFKQNIRNIDLVIGAKGSPLQIILSSVYHLDAPTGNIAYREFKQWAKHPLTEKAMPLAYGDSYRGYRIVGCTPAYPEHYQAKMARGKLFQEPFEVVIGASLAKQLKLTIGDEFYGTHGSEEAGEAHRHHAYQVVGVLEQQGGVLDKLILTPLGSVWQSHGNKVQDSALAITAGLFSFRSPMAQMMLPRQINAQSNLQAALPAIEMNRLFSLADNALFLVQGLSWAVLILSALSVFTALLESIKKEEGPLAYLRAIGITRAGLFRLILAKGLSLGLIGFALAYLLAHLGLFLVFNYLPTGVSYQAGLFLSHPANLGMAAAALALVLLSTLIPAWRAFRMNIANTLADA